METATRRGGWRPRQADADAMVDLTVANAGAIVSMDILTDVTGELLGRKSQE